MTRRLICCVLLLAVPLVVAAAEADAVKSRAAIEAALDAPPAVKTRGLKVQARGEESRGDGTQAQGGGAVDLQIPFELGSATLLPDARAQLAELAGALKSARLVARRFELAGHTDASGSPGFNRALSLARAEAVREFLAGQGVDAARLDVAGYGPDRPLAGRAPTDPLNRRVEVRSRTGAP